MANTAIGVVPPGIRSFLSDHADQIKAAATANSIQHTSAEEVDATSHFILLDAAAQDKEPAARQASAAAFPHDKELADQLFKQHRIAHGGTLPWVLIDHFDLLSRAFEAGEKQTILQEIAKLIHYSADVALPLNTTSLREGSEADAWCRSKRVRPDAAGQRCSLADRCQNEFVAMRRSRFEHEVRVWPGRFSAPSDPQEAVFANLMDSYDSIEAFVRSDQALRHDLGVTDFPSFLAHRSEYYDGLATRAAGTMENRLEAGALLAADLIGAAWIRAGRPSERYFTDPKVEKEEIAPAPAPVPEAAFVGSTNSKIFHRSDCRHAQRIRPDNLVHFPSAQAAMDAGRKPCRVCRPDQPVAAPGSPP